MNMKFTIRTVLPATISILLSASPSGAETYYVSPTGNNGYSGTIPDSAFATLHVRGQYSYSRWQRSCAECRVYRFWSENRWLSGVTHRLRGDGIISDAIVEANIIHDNGQNGGSAINCDGVVESVIFNNLLYNNHASGISLFMIDGATGSHDVDVYNNTIVMPDDGRWGININTGSTDASLRNNIVLNDHSWNGLDGV